jgi:lipopolysaccharide transport system ATP-binding protein
MTKKEITSKIDEIIEFSGCQRYIDTPVKRYSSGMTVRLGFAVAAFLEPEILVVDEVLAVGDAEFQKKAIGKMQDISRDGGRTVLFVSHNMAAVKSLCTRGIVLENGLIKFEGDIDEALTIYQNLEEQTSKFIYIGRKNIIQVKLHSLDNNIKYNDDLVLEVDFETENIIKNLVIGIVIKDENDLAIVGVNNNTYNHKINYSDLKEGKVLLTISKLKLLPGFYKIDLFLGDSLNDIEVVYDALKFNIIESYDFETVNRLNLKINKVFQEDIKWDLVQN